VETYAMVAAGLAIIYLFPRSTKAIPSPLVAIVILTIVSIYAGIKVNTVGDMGKLPRRCQRSASHRCRSRWKRCASFSSIR
jgi:MFS superfamily sulfate permease-like transporter